MAQDMSDAEHYRRRAEAEIQIAKASGAAKAEASADYKKVFIQRRDGTTETVRIPPPRELH